MFTSTSDHAHKAVPANVGDEDLHSAYIWSINSAIESGGDALAVELADSYRHESRERSRLRVLRSAA